MKQNKYSDQEIVDGILHQDKDVLLFIYSHNFNSIKKYVIDNNGAENDARDIFQDALIVIFEKIRNNDLKLTSSFDTYIYAIAKHHWLRNLRQQQARSVDDVKCDDLEMIEPGINEQLIQAEKKKLVIEHFNNISDDCKKIIQHLINGFSLNEITKLMGYKSVQHTKNRKLKCKKFLISSIMNSPRFKELCNGKTRELNQIPRW
jgi:RNA polymerase sigma factor (sigma-70 family)